MTEYVGWQGQFYEDFIVGDVNHHSLERTVTTTDDLWFDLLTQHAASLYLDHQHPARTAYGRPLVNSCLTLPLATGQSVSDVSQDVLANAAWDKVRIPNPVFEGDTFYSGS